MHSRLKKAFFKKSDGSSKEIRLHYISRHAFVPVAQSPWRKLLLGTCMKNFPSLVDMGIKSRGGTTTEAESDYLPQMIALG
eukprot:7506526-Ditylum_brightwellii.AAC.1